MAFHTAPSDGFDEEEEDLDALIAASAAQADDETGSEWEIHGPTTPKATQPRVTSAIDVDAMDLDTSAGSSKLAELDAEIQSLDEQIGQLQQLRNRLATERAHLLQIQPSRPPEAAPRGQGPLREGRISSKTIDYAAPNGWEWTETVKETMKRVWGITKFRLQQQAVINAVLHGRDVVCVMPTGAGKSLCFQLPALLTEGTTIVVSPLIALMTDQVLNLMDVGVQAVALTSASSKQENDRTLKRLSKATTDEPEIKLVYLTPERLAKSKSLVGTLSKMNNAGRLARFVIDESHCVSQLGHDYRPDFKRLSMLRQLYVRPPSVPIVSLTATCPPRVLDDMLQILSLRPATDGHAANQRGTVLFRAPLYRPNLHWSVLAKPSNAKEALHTLADWIISNHPDDTGIVYCLSQKDTETVAAGLREASANTIKSAFYHAGLDEGEKERVHHRWRERKIRVVVATIAFGLGIDKPDVRFVCHHTMSKSPEGLYQESGRAGRDGLDSDCVMFYRGQDANRIASMLAGDPEGATKLHAMLDYAMDLRTCRKILFSRYFAESDTLPALGGAKDIESPCTHCDNCLRDPASVESLDVRQDAWRVLKVLEAVRSLDGRVTNAQLADLARGLGGGTFNTAGAKGKTGKASIDIVKVAGSKVSLNKDDAETLVTTLLLKGCIKDMLHGTAYSILVYQQPGPNAIRFTRFTLSEVERGSPLPALSMTVPAHPKGRKRAVPKQGNSAAMSKKARKTAEEHYDDGGANFQLEGMSPHGVIHDEEDDEEGIGPDDWVDVTPALPPLKRPKVTQVLDLSE